MNHNDPVDPPAEYDPLTLYGVLLGVLTVLGTLAGLAAVWLP